MCLHRLAILVGKLVVIGLLGEAKTVVLLESCLHWVLLVGPEQLRRVLELPRSRKHRKGSLVEGTLNLCQVKSLLAFAVLSGGT